MGNKTKAKNSSSFQRTLQHLPDRSPQQDPLIVFSLRRFDPTQGQGFEVWEQEALLAKMNWKLRDISTMTRLEATRQQVIKEYAKVDFPPNSKFRVPLATPPGVTWASMHIQGKECVIGYFEEEPSRRFIFNIVFLDKDHEFWLTKRAL